MIDTDNSNAAYIEELTRKLVNYFGEISLTIPNLTDIDQFMAMHNAHVYFILQMEQQLQLNSQEQLYFRRMATKTFSQAMENKPEFGFDKALLSMWRYRMVTMAPRLINGVLKLIVWLKTNHEEVSKSPHVQIVEDIINLIEGDKA